jgi:hypothetical protein
VKIGGSRGFYSGGGSCAGAVPSVQLDLLRGRWCAMPFLYKLAAAASSCAKPNTCSKTRTSIGWSVAFQQASVTLMVYH